MVVMIVEREGHYYVQRVAQVRRVGGQHDPADAHAGRQSLVHAVRAEAGDLVVAGLRVTRQHGGELGRHSLAQFLVA